MALSKADKLKVIEIATKHGLETREVELMIQAPYEFIRSKAKDIEFNDKLTKEQFTEMKTNFNIPSIGKLYASYNIYERIIKNKKKKNLDNS